MLGYGDIPENNGEPLGESMNFRLDPHCDSPKKDDDPMWASASSPGDWFFADEGS